MRTRGHHVGLILCTLLLAHLLHQLILFTCKGIYQTYLLKRGRRTTQAPGKRALKRQDREVAMVGGGGGSGVRASAKDKNKRNKSILLLTPWQLSYEMRPVKRVLLTRPPFIPLSSTISRQCLFLPVAMSSIAISVTT